MNINQLKYVVTIAKTQNFSKAAEILYISQPAISQYIKRLEEEIGVELFIRDKSKVEITEAGEVFVEEAKKILELSDGLLNRMETFSQGTSSSITIGISQFYGKYFLPKVLPIIKDRNSNLSIQIHEAESKILESLLLKNEIDIGIFPLPIQSTKLRYSPIYKENMLFAINSNNKLSNIIKSNSNSEIDLSLFRDEPFVLLKKGFKMRELAETICSEYGFAPKVVFEAENFDTLNSLISNDMGVSFLPNMIQKLDNVEYFKMPNKYSTRLIVIAYNYLHPTFKVKHLIDTINEDKIFLKE